MFDFITEMQPADMVVIAILWVISVLVSTVLMWTLVIPKFLRNIILDMLANPTEKTYKAIQSMAVMILTTTINTKKKIKDEDGQEHDEVVPLLVYAGREIFTTMNAKLNAAKGGAKDKAAQVMMEAVANSGGDPRAALPIAMQSAFKGDYGPLLMVLAQVVLNKPQAPIEPQGGGGNYKP